MSIDVPFTKENLEGYLKELAKEYKKRGRGMPAEMILVGGACPLARTNNKRECIASAFLAEK